MKAEILTIGDELLIGQIVNTNAAWIGEQLSGVGVVVERGVTLGDEVEAIEHELAEAFRAVELVIITGGLGPTHDDVTKHALANFFEAPLRFDEASFEKIRARFDRRGTPMPESNRTQAMVPEGFEVLPNPIGTAPGLWHADVAGGRRRLVAILPGVPFEMKRLMQDHVLPRLQAQEGLRVIRHRTLLTCGIGESNLQARLGDLGDLLGPSCRLASLPGTSGTRLRLSAYADTPNGADRLLAPLEARLRERIGPYLYGTDEDTLEAVLGQMLTARELTLATAESSTGGYVAHRLTNVSGSSAYVIGGVVAYSNAVKVDVLGVDPALIEAHGAVSEAVVRQMAQGVRQRLGTDIGLATTGIMGPTGGTSTKPVGTVWLGYADAHGDHALLKNYDKGRTINKELASTAALNLVRLQLLDRKT